MEKIFIYGSDAQATEELLENFDTEKYELVALCDDIKSQKIIKKHPGCSVVFVDSSPNQVEFLQQIEKQNPESIYILIKKSCNKLDAESCFDLNAAAAFDKPIDGFKVARSIESLIDIKNAGRPKRAPRYWTKHKVQIKDAFEGRILNISRGGFFAMFSEWEPKVGEKVHFLLQSENDSDEALEGVAEVRWIKKGLGEWQSATDSNNIDALHSGIGFQFIDPNKQDLQKVLASLQHNLIYPVS